MWSDLHSFIFAQIYDYEYDHKDPKEESVLHDHAWGFCDPKCFVRKEDILALDLQEVPFRLKKYIRSKTPPSGEVVDSFRGGVQEPDMDSQQSQV